MSLSQMRLWQNRSSRCSLPTGIEEESGKGESLFLFPFIVFLSFIAIFVLYHTRKLDHRQERGGGGEGCSVHTKFHHMTHLQEGLLQFEPIQTVLCFR